MGENLITVFRDEKLNSRDTELRRQPSGLAGKYLLRPGKNKLSEKREVSTAQEISIED